MTAQRPGGDARPLLLAACLGIPLLVLLLTIGSVTLLHTFEGLSAGTSERPASFVCMSDVGGTLLLCEPSYGAPNASATPL